MRALISLALSWTLLAVTPVSAAELYMSWAGHQADGQRTIDLSVGQTATVQIWLTLPASDTCSGVSFTNEVAAALSQQAVSTTLPNWSAGGVNGSLDGFYQQAVYFAILPLQESIEGPGEFLLGEQQLRLNSGSAGQQFEITFALIQTFFVSNSTGADHTLVVTGNPSQDEPGFVHLGVGSPGYTRAGGQVDERDPLIVRVVASGGSGGTGGDGGGGGGGDGGGGTDPGDDGMPGDDDDMPDDPDDPIDTNGIGDFPDDGDGIDDPVDEIPQEPGDTPDPGDDGGDDIGDNLDPDDDIDGLPDDGDPGPIGGDEDDDGPGSGDSGSTPPRSGGICGSGAAMIVPINLLALGLLHGRSRRWR